jgi:hypothetical protein
MLPRFLYNDCSAEIFKEYNLDHNNDHLVPGFIVKHPSAARFVMSLNDVANTAMSVQQIQVKISDGMEWNRMPTLIKIRIYIPIILQLFR